MTRETLINEIMHRWHVQTEKELMNELQEHGIISDNAAEIGDVADCDLVRAYNLEGKL
jgi:arginine repressor